MPIETRDMKAGFARMAELYDQAMPHVFTYADYSIDAAPPVTSSSVVHDNACGPGVVSSRILANFQATDATIPKIIATDINPDMVATAKKAYPGLDARLADSKNLDLPEKTFTHSFTNFLLSPLFSEEDNLVFAKNVRKVMAPGGTAVITCWRELAWQVILRDAANEVRPDGASFVRDDKYPEEMIRKTLVDAGFSADAMQISCREALQDPITPGPVREVMDIVSGMIGNMVTATWSDEQKQMWPAKLKERLDRAEAEETRFPIAAWVIALKC